MAALLDYSLWSTWQALYDLDAESDIGPVFRPHVRLSYHRAVLMKAARLNAQAYVSKLGWTTGQHIVIGGCGFGWSTEILIDELGFTNVVGIDVSTFIQTNKATTEEADINAGIVAVGLSPLVGEGAIIKGKLFDGGPRARKAILNQDGATVSSRNAIKSALGGGNVDIVLTEDMLTNFPDADCLVISTNLHKLAGTVQHLVTPTRPGNEAVQNWKTLAQWKALLPADTFMSTGDYQVV